MLKQFVTIGKRKYAIGIFWQPKNTGVSARNYAKKLSKIDKEYNLFIEYENLIGLSSRNFKHKRGMPSLAVQFIETYPDLNSFLASFQIDEYFWVVALRNGVILSDKVFINEQGAKDWYNELLKVPNWNYLIAPNLWNIQKASEINIKDVLFPKPKIVLKNINSYKYKIVFLISIIFVIVFFILKQNLIRQYVFKNKINLDDNVEQETLNEEKNEDINIKQKDLDFETIEKNISINMPYYNLYNKDEYANLCFKTINFLMQTIAGYKQTIVKCENNKGVAKFITESGNIKYFYKKISDTMAGVEVEEFSDNSFVVKAQMPSLKTYKTETEYLNTEEDSEIEIKGIFQEVKIPIVINKNTEIIKNKQQKAEVKTLSFNIETKLKPDTISNMLSEFKAVKFNLISWNNETRIWNYEVVIYVK